jgi:hypothetical protein
LILRFRIERHASGSTTEERSQVVKFSDIVEGSPTRVFLELLGDEKGGSKNFFVQKPSFRAETFLAFFPVFDFVLEQFVQSTARSGGPVVVKRSSARLPIVAGGKAAQAMQRATEFRRRF